MTGQLPKNLVEGAQQGVERGCTGEQGVARDGKPLRRYRERGSVRPLSVHFEPQPVPFGWPGVRYVVHKLLHGAGSAEVSGEIQMQVTTAHGGGLRGRQQCGTQTVA